MYEIQINVIQTIVSKRYLESGLDMLLFMVVIPKLTHNYFIYAISFIDKSCSSAHYDTY